MFETMLMRESLMDIIESREKVRMGTIGLMPYWGACDGLVF